MHSVLPQSALPPTVLSLQTPEQWKASLNNIRPTRIIESKDQPAIEDKSGNKIYAAS